MSCPALASGDRFLASLLTSLDCHALSIGAYGYGALADPGSPAAGLLLALLTLFIALFGLRLMFGEAVSGRDVAADFLRLGIVLTLATSWPAWRTLAYQTVLAAPQEVAGNIGSAAGLPGSHGDLNERLSNADKGLVALTAFGTGRLTGGVIGSTDLGDSASGIALADQTGFGWGRILFLVGVIGPLALVRLTAGLLLALAPIMAGLLLFAGTRDLFLGWLRGLGACALGAMALGLVYAAELALLEGWLREVLVQREANILVPAAPTELLVLALAFAAVAWSTLGFAARVMFFSAPLWPRSQATAQVPSPARSGASLATAPAFLSSGSDPVRAVQLAESVSLTMRREERLADSARHARGNSLALEGSSSRSPAGFAGDRDALGQSYRRGYRRQSATAARRDAAS